MHRYIVLTLALVACAVIFTTAMFAAEAPQVGQMAPGFTLPSQDGTSISLKDFKGKWVVLYFYPKDKTPGCTIEAHNFQRDKAKYDQMNTVILGISVDSVDSHKSFGDEQSVTFKLISDEQKQVVPMYGSLRDNGMALRNTFLLDPQGKIAKVWTGVDPNKHSVEVLAALGEVAK
jgi:thioredoxin-dependent peroxiredoxin